MSETTRMRSLRSSQQPRPGNDERDHPYAVASLIARVIGRIAAAVGCSGELDHGIPLDQVNAIAEAHPDVAVHDVTP